MTLGFDVNKGTLDMKAAQAVLALRGALDLAESIAKWLANHPITTDSTTQVTTDPLTQEPFNYTADEAYALRYFFESVDGIRTSNAALIDVGRKMTGLE